MEMRYCKYFLPLDCSLPFSSAVKQPVYLPYFLVCKNSVPCTQEEKTDFYSVLHSIRVLSIGLLRIALIYSLLTQYSTEVSV